MHSHVPRERVRKVRIVGTVRALILPVARMRQHMIPQMRLCRRFIFALIAVQDPGRPVAAVNCIDVLRECLPSRRLERARGAVKLFVAIVLGVHVGEHVTMEVDLVREYQPTLMARDALTVLLGEG